jgi:assimilatory nitrate reductase electron transfer subunit
MSAATLRRVVVVGNGMTGIRFVQELVERDLDRRLDVTVVGDEPGGAYNRMQLSNVLAGSAREDAITLAGFDWYAANGVRLLAGRSVTAIDRRCRAVALDDGTSLPYDELVLATGSEAVLPPIEGLLRDGDLVPGAVLFRTLDDCMRIDRLARTAYRAVVLGAGVLGLEAARALAGRGLHVTLVQRGARLMERQLDADAARVLSRTLRDLGIDVVTGAEVARVDAGRSLEAVALADGRVLPAELLVTCCGVRPRVSLAAGAGLSVGRGVVVDDELRSVSDARVRAIGECAEHRGECVGLVAPCWDQARVAAQLSVDPSATIRYTATPVVTRLKARGIELATMGESDGQDDEADNIVRFSDSGRGVYQKLVVRDGRLVGAILLGDTRTVGTVTQLYDRGAELPVDRASVLMVRRNAPASTAATPTALPARTTVCQCNGVTKGAITAAWTDGARSVEAIAARTRATTGCGTCRDTVCGLVDWLASSDPDPVEPATALSAASLTALSPS